MPMAFIAVRNKNEKLKNNLHIAIGACFR